MSTPDLHYLWVVLIALLSPKADERKAIAERIVALWRSRTVARRQLVVYGRELEAPYDDYYRQYTRAPKNEYTARGREETIPEPGSDPIDRPRRQERDVSPASFHRSPRRYTHRERSPDIFPDEKPHQNRDSYDYTYYPRPEANGLPFAPDLDPVNEKSTKRQVIDYVLGFVLAPGDDAAGTRQNVNELWDLYKHNPAALRRYVSAISTGFEANDHQRFGQNHQSSASSLKDCEFKRE